MKFFSCKALAALVATAATVAPLAAPAPALAADAALNAAQVAGDTPLATVNRGALPMDPAPVWRKAATEHADVVQELWAHSPSMNRDVPLLLIPAKDQSQPRPILYLLNGGDGGEGSLNWLNRTDLVDFYRDKNVNVVMPMAGKYSYYTDWVTEIPHLGGKQNWETFLTKELPGPLEKTLNASNQRAIMGMSMSGTSALLLPEHNPGFYNSAVSLSGCAETDGGVGNTGMRLTMNRGRVTPEQMWGPMGTANWYNHDALINAEKLRGTELYIAAASGTAGKWDMPDSPYVKNPLSMAVIIAEGGIIEGASSKCTHDLQAKLGGLGVPAHFEFNNTGTHQWGYWMDEMHKSWPTIAHSFGMEP